MKILNEIIFFFVCLSDSEKQTLKEKHDRKISDQYCRSWKFFAP